MEHHDDDVIDIGEYIRAIWRYRVLVLAAILACQAAFVAKSMKKERRYSSISQFIFKTGSQPSPLSQMATVIGIPTGGMKPQDISTYFDVVLFSDAFLAKILARNYGGSKGDSIPLAELWKRYWKDVPEDPDEYRRFRRYGDHLAGGKYILVTRAKTSGVITLETQFERPDVSLQVNEHILKLLGEYLLSDAKSQARENRKFVEERLKEVDRDLRRSEDRLAEFNQRNLSTSSPALLLELGRLKREVALNQEVFTQLKKQFEMAKIDEMKENPLMDVIAAPNLSLGPIGRGTVKKLILGTGLGSLAGIFLAILVHWSRLHIFRRPKPLPRTEQRPKEGQPA